MSFPIAAQSKMECAATWSFMWGALSYAVVYEAAARGALVHIMRYVPTQVYVPAYFMFAGAKLGAQLCVFRSRRFIESWKPKQDSNVPACSMKRPRRVAQTLTSEFMLAEK